MFLSIEISTVAGCSMIGNVLAVPVEDPTSNNILRSALEVCNTGGHEKKIETPFNYVLVFHFQKAQRQFCRIAARCGCQERDAEDVYCTVPVGLDFGAGLSYGAGMSSAAAAHDDNILDLGPDLDTTVDVQS
jgi:hypothetical protein